MQRFYILIVIVLFFGLPMHVRSVSDFNQFDAEETHAFLSRIVHDGDLVFDVGANIGKKAKLYLQCGARVVCFEPQVSCIDILTSFTGNDQVVVEPYGLGAKEGQCTFFVCPQASTISTCHEQSTVSGRFVEHGYTWTKAAPITLTTLDKMILKYGVPRYCKIDVEGFELEVLTGLSQKIPWISFECNFECFEITKKCIDYLCLLGYTQFNFAPGERGLFFFDAWLSGDELKENIVRVAKMPAWREVWGLWGDVYARA